MRTAWLRCTLLFLLLVPPGIHAQDRGEHSLVPGPTLAHTLAAGETRTYEVQLEADRFVAGRVEQDGVEVQITVVDPEGERAARFATPLGKGTPQSFQFTAEVPGTWRIVVAPRDDGGEGPYRIRLTRSEPVATTPEGRVDQAMAMFAEDTPGGVVAVIRQGEVDFLRAYGAADLAHGAPFTAETPTNIGSTSKQFTGFALALLQARGQLSLEDDVRVHLPELKDFGETITLRNLLTHTTGYREFVNTLLMGGRQVLESDHVARDEVVEVINRQPELQNPPGAEFNYNNTAFGLATLVVERVTGKSFGEWMEDEVFRPLGMNRTWVRMDPGQVIPGRAAGYTPGEVGFREVRDLGASMGAGGIYTTPGDLARWMGNLGTGALGGEEVIRELTTPYVLTTGDTTSYGLGLFMDEQRGLRRWQHGGSDVAHRSTFVYYPDLDAGYVVLSNYAAGPGGLGNLVAEAFFGEHLAPPRTPSRQAAQGPSGEEDPDQAEEPIEPPALAQFAGRYFSEELETFYHLGVEDDRLVIRHRRFGPAPLSHAEGDVFTGTLPVTRLEFERDADGRVMGFRAGNVRARDIWFQRTEP